MLFSRFAVVLCLVAAAGSMMVSCAKQPSQPEPAVTAGGTQELFATPEDAVVALIDAARSGNFERLVPIFGTGVADFGAETKERTEGDMQRLAAAYDRSHVLVAEADGSVTLQVDEHNWEFPAPLVQVTGGWRFDTDAGIAELKSRRMDKNQEDAVLSLQDCVEAQERFRAMNPDGLSPTAFASRILSTPGNRDGLWWSDDLGSPLSPLGPTLAAAIESGDAPADIGTKPQPYRGYFFRMLDAQGPSAPGGARSFRGADGRQTEGFAIIAWPAEYAKTGFMSFMVSGNGPVYQRDLGPDGDGVARGMTSFDPGEGWSTLDGLK